MEGWQSWGIPFVIVGVIYALNTNCRGTHTQVVEGVLAVALLGLLVVAFCVSGFGAGLVALLGLGAIVGFVGQRPRTQL